MTTQQDRPWYCDDDAVDEYKSALKDDGEPFPMLKLVKAIKATIVNLGIVAISLLAIYYGGDPTLLGLLALAVLGGYNGLEMGDYMALLQAYKEVQTPDDNDSK